MPLSPITDTYSYTGSTVTWTVPSHEPGSLTIDVFGAQGGSNDDALVLAVAKVLGADPAEVRKKRDENPQWFADVVAQYGLDRDKEG